MEAEWPFSSLARASAVLRGWVFRPVFPVVKASVRKWKLARVSWASLLRLMGRRFDLFAPAPTASQAALLASSLSFTASRPGTQKKCSSVSPKS